MVRRPKTRGAFLAIIVMHLDTLHDFVNEETQKKQKKQMEDFLPRTCHVYQLSYRKHKRNSNMNLRVPLSR